MTPTGLVPWMMGYYAQVFLHKFSTNTMIWADNSAQNQHFVLLGGESTNTNFKVHSPKL